MKKLIIGTSLLALQLVMALAFVSITPPASAQRPEPSPVSVTGTGHITGTVRSDVSLAPLEFIHVSAYEYNGSSWFPSYSDVTDSNGLYDISNMDPGTYRVKFQEFAYPSSLTYAFEYYDDVVTIDSASDIVVTEGGTVTGVDADLALAGHITGTVTSHGGDPLEKVKVAAFHYEDNSWMSVEVASTDASGHYDISGLATNTYRLSFYGLDDHFPEYYDDVLVIEMAEDISVTAGSTTAGIDAALESGGTIFGTVSADDGGGLLEGIRVCADQDNGHGWINYRCTRTENNGEFILGPMELGFPYRFHFSDQYQGQYAKEYLLDAADAESAMIILSGNGGGPWPISLATAAHITGTVTAENGGAPLPNIDVEALRLNGSSWEQAAFDQTNGLGIYDLGGLQPGSYRISFEDHEGGSYAPEFYHDVLEIESAADVAVAAAGVTNGIDAALADAGHIRGTVIDEVSSGPLSGIDVEGYRSVGLGWELFSKDTTDSSGSYDLGGLLTGSYRLAYLDSNNGSYITEYYNDAAGLESASGIHVASTRTVYGADASLGWASHITGTVTAESGGKPLYDIDVCAYYDDGSEWQVASCARTDYTGRYDVGSLPPGSYRLFFDDPQNDYAWEYYQDKYDIGGAADVVVAAGSITGDVDVQLADSGTISGMVTAAAAGTQLEHIDVKAYRFNGSAWVFVDTVHTFYNGFYRLHGLPLGQYKVGFFDEQSGDFAYEFFSDVADLPSASVITMISGDAIGGIDAALDEYGQITGTVYALFVGAPVESIEVCAWGDDGGTWNTFSFCASTDSAGFFDITRLRTGIYRVQFSDPYGRYQGEHFHNAPNIISAADVPVTAGGSNNLFAYLGMLNPETQDIPLIGGWNMISSYVEPQFPAMETVMAGIASDMIMAKNGDGQVYWPSMAINTIGDWDVHDGYHIFMNAPDTLSFNGQQVDPQKTPIFLESGWSMVAGLRDGALPSSQSFSTLDTDLVLAKNGLGEVFWPSYGVDQIVNLQPGEGYQVYLDQPAVLLFPAN